MNSYELWNGLVLALASIGRTSSFDGNWFQKQCDDDEKATGCSVKRMREECQWRKERCLFSWLIVCITLCMKS
jgi:hypothetical protein